MSIIVKKFSAPQIISHKSVPALRGHLEFANGIFTHSNVLDKKNFIGGGIYGVMLDDRLIYVGKFQGKKKNWRDGNVVSSRWIKHIGTFTMLDRRLSFSKKAMGSVLKDINSIQSSSKGLSVLGDGVLGANSNVLTRDMGLSSTFSRYMIAKKLWSEEFIESNWMERFSFLYARLTESENTATARMTISLAEEKVIKELQPPANSTSLNKRTHKINTTEVEAVEVFLNALNIASQSIKSDKGNDCAVRNYMIQERMHTELLSDDELMYERSRQQRFYDKLEEAPNEVKRFIATLTDHIETHPFASIEYTGSEKTQYQLRIRRHIDENRGFINAITLTWQKRKNCFRMRHNLPSNVIKDAGLIIQSESSLDPLHYASDVTMDIMESKKDQLLTIFDEAIKNRHP